MKKGMRKSTRIALLVLLALAVAAMSEVELQNNHLSIQNIIYICPARKYRVLH